MHFARSNNRWSYTFSAVSRSAPNLLPSTVTGEHKIKFKYLVILYPCNFEKLTRFQAEKFCAKLKLKFGIHPKLLGILLKGLTELKG
jgi:hypothetical protein